MSDCSNHRGEVAGISDMKALAEMIGDLHYEALTALLFNLSDKIFADAQKDIEAKRDKLGYALISVSSSLYDSAARMNTAWEISKPFMKK